jgi:hypothetical protein
MKQVLLMIAVVALVGCGSPQGINQTSKVKIGTPIWEFETGGAVRSSPAISSDGTLYFWSSNNNLYVIKTNSPSQHEGLEFDSPWLHHFFYS